MPARYRFVEADSSSLIVPALSQQLSWSHFIQILSLKKSLEREYYAELCRVERRSVCTLRERIGSRLYLRMAIARKPECGAGGNQPPARAAMWPRRKILAASHRKEIFMSDAN